MPLETLPRIAVTGLGRGESPQPGAAVIASLRRRWPSAAIAGLAYDAMESGIYAPGHPDISFTLPYPSCGPAAFLDRLDEIRERFPFSVLIPTLDAEMEPLLRLRAQLEQRGIQALLPEAKSFDTRRKQNLADLAERAGVKTPRTYVVTDANEAAECASVFSGPVMVKGAWYDALRAESPIVARMHASRLFAEWGGPVLVQEVIEGTEFDFLAVGDGKGGISGSCAIRKLVVSSRGKGYAGITVEEPELNAAVRALMAELQWLGPLEFEFMRSPLGSFHLIEINPRFPAWADFPAAIGCNLAAVALQQLLGRPVETPAKSPAGKMFLRHNTDIVCDAGEFGRLASEGCTEPDARHLIAA